MASALEAPLSFHVKDFHMHTHTALLRAALASWALCLRSPLIASMKAQGYWENLRSTTIRRRTEEQ